MKNLIKDILPKRLLPLAKGAYNTFFNPNRQNGYPSNPYRDAHRILDIESPVIVDGGSYIGEMTELFLELFDDATVYAFEPVPRHIDTLKNKFSNNPSVRVYEIALGAENKQIKINIPPKSDTSSVHQLTGNTLKSAKRKNKIKKITPTNSANVQQMRLDSVISSCDIIKLDLQGHELQALRGSRELLQNCQAIISEVSFVPIFEDGALFGDLYGFLKENDFRLYNLYVGSTPSGQIRHGDALFLEESVYDNSEFDINWFINE